jgi:hypothetical protein
VSFAQWMQRQHLTLEDVSDELLTRFAKHRCRCPGGRKQHSPARTSRSGLPKPPIGMAYGPTRILTARGARFSFINNKSICSDLKAEVSAQTAVMRDGE